MIKPFWAFALPFLFAACTQELKPINETEKSDSFFEQNHETGHNKATENHVVVKEIMNGQRYSYLMVNDGSKDYWISTLKNNFEVGKEYSYTEAIYKTDFYSTEFNQHFDEFYLVSDLHPSHDHASHSATNQENIDLTVSRIEVERPGSIAIEKLVKNAANYVNTEVQVTGKVIKVNPNIMERNWIHLKDASYDDYDFVLTSKTAVPVGHIVTFKGVLHKDVNFGSGYFFDFIIENAQIVQ